MNKIHISQRIRIYDRNRTYNIKREGTITQTSTITETILLCTNKSEKSDFDRKYLCTVQVLRTDSDTLVNKVACRHDRN